MKRIPWLFGIYCILMVWIILFKLSFSLEDLQALAGQRSINLIPFHYENEVSSHWSEVWNNILIFIPFGVYLKMLGKGSGQAILLGLLMSFAFEFCQYLFCLGALDITDLITNTLGTTLGVLVYWLAVKILRSRERTHKVLGRLALWGTLALLALILLLMLANG